MTIVAAVKSRDALVIGTDSVTTIISSDTPPAVIKSYSNATKLFQLRDHQLIVATFGAGNIGNHSIGSIVLDYAETLTVAPSSVQKVAAGLEVSVGKVYDTAFAQLELSQRPVLGFLVGGYSKGEALAELWEVRFPYYQGGSNRTVLVRGPDDFGANWRGIEIPFTRLHMGFDPRLVDTLTQLGIAPDVALKTLQQFETPVIFDAMPIQDTVDFARWILRTTIGASTFEIGVPACGDPLQLACLRRRGFEWVEEPRFHV
jgi:hypothetical protein